MRYRFRNSNAFSLFLVSFLILFFELVCIRWLSSYVLYLGYFTNFVLLGSLLGIGAGALLAHKPYKLLKWLPAVLFVFLVGSLFAGAQVNPDFADIIYFTNNIAIIRLPPYILLPIIFIGVAVIFTLLAQDLGVLLTKFAPLKAYTLNILGSLAGIVFFMVISFLWLPSWVWFLVFAIFIIPFLPAGRSLGINIILLLGLVGVVAASDYTLASIWSPYYRLNLFQVGTEDPLKPDGIFVLYNYYRNERPIGKIVSMRSHRISGSLPWLPKSDNLCWYFLFSGFLFYCPAPGKPASTAIGRVKTPWRE
jgi:hypothetical protein